MISPYLSVPLRQFADTAFVYSKGEGKSFSVFNLFFKFPTFYFTFFKKIIVSSFCPK